MDQIQEPQSLSAAGGPAILGTLGTAGIWLSEHDDTPVLGPGKPFALIVYLASLPGVRARREHLLDLLWSDLQTAAAGHALAQTVWDLKRRFGKPPIRSVGDQLLLDLPLTYDRTRFVTAVEEGRLGDAVRIYQGPFLSGFAVPGGIGFEHWADVERERLRLLFIRTLQTHAREQLDQGHARQARDLARRMRDADPLDQSAWRLLLEAYVANGDRLSALGESHGLERLLAAEGHVAEPATQELLRSLRTEQPAEPGVPSAQLVGELVGREQVFASLISAGHAAAGGRGQVTAVVAPAGLGKTRLLQDLARRLGALGMSALYVRARPGDRDIRWAYAAEVARALSAMAGAQGVSPAAAASLVALDPGLSGRFTAHSDASAGDEAVRRRLLALVDLADAVAGEAPVALLLDDLHWSDAVSRDVLLGMTQRLTAARVLVVFASRHGDLFAPLGSRELITLHPLDPAQVEALVASLGSLPATPWARSLARRLCEAASGSPLLVLETLQLALERRTLTLTDGEWTAPEPATLDALLAAGSALHRRTAGLERAEGWVLLLLAVAGRELPEATLVAATGGDRVHADLLALERRGLAARTAAGWRIGHDELADSATAQATAAQLRAAHAALGRALAADRTTAETTAASARHLALGGARDEAVARLVRYLSASRRRGDRRPARAVVSDLLSSALDAATVDMLASALPLHVRLGARRGLALAAGGLALILAVVGMWMGRNPDSGVTLATWVAEPGGWRLFTHVVRSMDPAESTIDVGMFVRTDLVSPHLPRGMPRPGHPGVLATTRTFPDSGGEEIVLLHGGAETRLTFQPGDDYASSWSPDGRLLAIYTDRWTDLSRSDVAILDPDHPDSVYARLSFDPDAVEADPLWSPDGTRLAFTRGHYDEEQSGLCVVTIDGQDSECFRLEGFTRPDVRAWATAMELVLSVVDSSGDTRIVAYDLATRAHRHIAVGQTTRSSRVAGWISCFCQRSGAERPGPLVIPVSDPSRAIRLTPEAPPAEVWLFPSAPSASYLDHIRIVRPQQPVPVDGSYRLQLDGWSAAGDPMEPLAVRWRSLDTTVATISPDGRLRPLRQGAVRIHATAGGWRSDTMTITIGPPDAVVIHDERWDSTWQQRWTPFGTPQPYVTATDRGAAFVPNGDSTFFSGVFLADMVPLGSGMGLELELSTPITAIVWQHMDIQIVAPHPDDRDTWDLDRGRLPIRQSQWRSCAFQYPAFENNRGVEQFALGNGISRVVRAPDRMRDGSWVRVRLQILPDGSCGVALDGEPVAIIDRRTSIGDSAMVMVHSYSHRTRFLVGRLQIWLGVRGDVDWNQPGAVRP